MIFLDRDEFNSDSFPVEFQAIALIQSKEVALTKTGKEYLRGTVQTKTGNIAFQIWSNLPAFQTIKEMELPRVVSLIGNYNLFAGNKTLQITEIAYADENLQTHREKFLQTRYNETELTHNLMTLVDESLTPNGKTIFNLLWEKTKHRFTKEYAAINHHDNVLHGLLAHSYKVGKLMHRMILDYPDITTTHGVSKDLLIIGAIFHDIGKIDEYKDGSANQFIYATHRLLGLQYLFEIREQITDLYDEEWFWRFGTIITQHHGQWGEPPKTIEAFLVHKVDYLDSTFTSVVEGFEKTKRQTPLRLDDFMLS